MRIAVIGLGKIGLPLAAKFAKSGKVTIGVDLNAQLVEDINSCNLETLDEPFVRDAIYESVKSSTLKAVKEIGEAVPYSDIVVVVVPLILDQNSQPDYSVIEGVAQGIGEHLRRDTLVVFETTLPIGATRKRLVPILERESGLEAGIDFFVAYSPERVYSGQVFENLSSYPKLIGGINRESEKLAKKFYESVLDFTERPDLIRPNGVWPLGSCEAAEFAKLAETTYRDVNIALANQFATHAQTLGVDVYKVIEACNSQPFSHIHQPGVAVGGHCIPVYPQLYLSTDSDAKLVSEARNVNLKMPARAVMLLEGALGTLSSKRIVILGLAYRGGVKESAYSGAWSLAAELERRGATVMVHDPLFSDAELHAMGLKPFHLGEPCEGAILHSNHKEYMYLHGTDFTGLQAIVDGRNILNSEAFPNSKVVVIGIG